MDQQAAASVVAGIVGTLAALLMKLLDVWKGRRKMKAEQLRMLADALRVEAARNIQAGMVPLTDAMNSSAPFARTPQPIEFISSQRPAAFGLPPQPVDVCTCDDGPIQPCPTHQHGTFFWPGLAEEEIRKEREGR